MCRGDGLQAGGAPGAANDGSKGIDVVNKGQVGIFDWTLVKAETKEAFTDWLDANGFPHQPAADTQFAHYVKEGFYFVAFKVTASDSAPPAGKRICGDFGPIELAFSTTKPLVPTRIASVSANGQTPAWKIYALSSHDEQLAITAQSSYAATPSYADELTATSLASTPQLAKLAAPGDQLVRMQVGFGFADLDSDLVLSSTKPTQLIPTADQIEYVDCPDGKLPASPGGDGSGASGSASASDDGCAVSTDGPARGVTTLALSLAAVLLVRRRRRAS